MYKPLHFATQELVSRQTYLDRGEKALQLFDDRLLRLIDYLRDKFGRATINDWQYGGNNEWRGLRTPDSPYYSKYSQHSFGRAFDIIFKDYTAQEVRDWLKNNALEWQLATGLKSVTCEAGVSWLHIDLRNNKYGYNEFQP